jgi:hypothetical protein
MMKHTLVLSLGLLAALSSLSAPARADIDLQGALLVGTGVATSEIDNNPYALQLGGVAELNIDNFVIGFRGTRSVSSNDCDAPCRNVNDLRSLGGDVGYEWDLSILHLGPRVGFGQLKEKDGDIAGGYVEPGGVADVQIAIFTAGVDLRYRFAVKESDLNAFLAYARFGLRF